MHQLLQMLSGLVLEAYNVFLHAGAYTTGNNFMEGVLVHALMTGKAGYGACSAYIDKYTPTDRACGPKQLPEPVVVRDGREVAVWRYMVGNKSGISSGEESITEMAKRVEWAFVLKVRIGKDQGNP